MRRPWPTRGSCAMRKKCLSLEKCKIAKVRKKNNMKSVIWNPRRLDFSEDKGMKLL
jgi:hypothetical protein